jgi:propionyl-CoA carboxylase beta chain
MSHDLTTTAGKIADFRDRQARAEQPSGPEAIEKQHARGKNTARERIDLLLDEGSFVEFDALAVHRSTAFGMEKKKPLGDGLVSGYGTVDGRPVAVYSQDFSVYGGSLSQVNGEKIVKVQEFALRNGCPVVGILDGGGARIQEGVASLAMFADIFRNNVHASGVVPQISLIMGPSAGGAAYSPALTDYVVMVDKTSHMFITGPDVIKTVTGEDVDMETLGGARQHNANTGTSTYLAADEADAVEFVRELLDFLPSNNLAEAPVLEHQQELEIDDDDLALDALSPDSANQPMQFSVTLDISASEKAARFVRHCDAFNIPIITLVDVPGFLPGKDQEFQGIIRRGAKLLYAYAEATVPKLTVITRKAYGGAYIVMGSKKLGADLNLAWPTAQIGVMGAQGAVNILYRRELAAVAEAGGDVEAKRADVIRQYEEELLNPYQAAQLGYVDAVIAPSETRVQIIRGLRALRDKRASLPAKKHGNIPL